MRPDVGHGQRDETGTILTIVPSVTDARRQKLPMGEMIAVPLVLPDEALDLAELGGRVQAWERDVGPALTAHQLPAF